MTGHRLPIFRPRLGLSNHYSGGPSLTPVNGKNIQPAKKQKVKASTFSMEGGSDPLHDPITAPPESSDDESEITRTENAAPYDSHDSDEDYDRHRTANIRATTFDKTTLSTANNAQFSTRASQASGGNSYSSMINDTSGLAGSKRSAEEDEPKAANQLKRGLDVPFQKKKKPPLMKYGLQQKTKRQNASQSTYSASQDISKYKEPIKYS